MFIIIQTKTNLCFFKNYIHERHGGNSYKEQYWDNLATLNMDCGFHKVFYQC